MFMVEKKYIDMQEEVNEQREVIDKLKNKYQAAVNDLKDLEEEQQCDKEDLMQTVRQQELDIKFYKRIVQMLMKDSEIAKIKHKSQYDDDAVVKKGIGVFCIDGENLVEIDSDLRLFPLLTI